MVKRAYEHENGRRRNNLIFAHEHPCCETEPGGGDAHTGAESRNSAPVASGVDPVVPPAATRGSPEGPKRPAPLVKDGPCFSEAKKRRHTQEALSPFSADNPPPDGGARDEKWFKTADPRSAMVHALIWASHPKNEIEALSSILVIEVILFLSPLAPLLSTLLTKCLYQNVCVSF